MGRKVDLVWVLFGFGVSYIFFGLSLIMPLFPDYTRIITGVGALAVGMVFFIIAVLNLPEKDKKSKKISINKKHPKKSQIDIKEEAEEAYSGKTDWEDDPAFVKYNK